MQSKNVNVRESLDPDRMEHVNLNDPDELEAQLELLDVVRSRKPTIPKNRSSCKWICCRILIISIIFIPPFAFFLVEMLRETNIHTYLFGDTFLPEAPSDLADRCSEHSIQTEEGLLECKRECEVADCCDYPANLALSCLKGNEDKCLDYHASCHILRGNETSHQTEIPTSIPTAPVNISDVCKPQRIITSSGFAECRTACEQAQCCYDIKESKSCTHHHHDKCQDYAVCLNLAAIDHIHEKIKAEIDEKCSPQSVESELGVYDCIHSCSHATCCFAGESHPQIEPCVHENTGWCEQYRACNSSATTLYVGHGTETTLEVLDGESGQSESETSAAQIREACIEAPQPSLCLELCKPGDCCFHHHGCENDENPNEDCLKYITCYVNYDVTDDDDVTSGDTSVVNVDALAIAEACHDSTADTVGELCAELCKAGKCCFESQDCEGSSSCDMYASCYVLYGAEQGSGNPENNGGTVVESSSMALTKDVETREPPDFEDAEPPDEVEGLFPPSPGEHEMGSSEIAEVCRDSTPENVDPQCSQLCEPAKCCFIHHDCQPNGVVCDKYASCFVVYGVTDDDDIV